MDDFADQPWNEAQWERFMQRSEVRSARYGELLETLHDHPDGDRIIAREMGWHRTGEVDYPDPEDLDAAEIDPEGEGEPFVEGYPLGEGDPEAESDPELEELENLPAYRLAREVNEEVYAALRPCLQQLVDDRLDETGERLVSAESHALIMASKIAGAHGMGYHDGVLCGHIVMLRVSLKASQTAAADLEWLARQQVLPAARVEQLGRRLEEVAAAVSERITELRARVWWE